MKSTVIIDWNNLCYSKLHNKEVTEKDSTYEIKSINYEIWKFKIFESLYFYFKKFSGVNEVVVASDYGSWRKLIYPQYKGHRSKQRNKFNIDWEEFSAIHDSYFEELKEFLPFKFLKIRNCEADDVIGTLVLNNRNFKWYVFSSDSDYLQLSDKNCVLYDTLNKKEMSHPNPTFFLKEIALTGQRKDNIFNVLTPVDYPEQNRKPPLGEKGVEKILINGLEKFLDQKVSYKKKHLNENNEEVIYNSEIYVKDRYVLNMKLCDLSKTPESLKGVIFNKYETYVLPEPENIWKFVKKYNWKWCLDNFTQIENSLLPLYGTY